jgi:chaperone required for assembly of F1-ATPase
MRDLFEDIFQAEPIDPTEAARRAMRAPLRKRFFREACVEAADGAFCVLLDGRAVKTPGRRSLALPTCDLAEAVATEWQNQSDVIDPIKLPLTRLANTIIDGVVSARSEVAAEIEKYLGSDLLFYRAAEPERLVARQRERWDPILAWAREALGARFALAQGVMFVTQPPEAVMAACRSLPQDAWRLGAVHVITTLTGSALIALALAHGKLTVEEAWAAAHVDEDWNMELWGQDELALSRRAVHLTEMQAAATVLRLLASPQS